MAGDCPHLSPTTPVLTCLPTPSCFLLRWQLLTRREAFPRGALTTAPGTDRPLVFDPRRRAAAFWFSGPKRIPLSGYQGTSA
jgi:hypothetical protein